MAKQQAVVPCDKKNGVWGPLRVKRRFSPARKSLDVVRNLLQAHKATA